MRSLNNMASVSFSGSSILAFERVGVVVNKKFMNFPNRLSCLHKEFFLDQIDRWRVPAERESLSGDRRQFTEYEMKLRKCKLMNIGRDIILLRNQMHEFGFRRAL